MTKMTIAEAGRRAMAERNARHDAAEAVRAAPEAATQPVKVAMPLTEEEIAAMNREAQDQGVSGIAPSLHLARAIQRAFAEKNGMTLAGGEGQP